MTAKAIETCYACDQTATTKEHAPPKSFFPEAQRHNLITVPSCALHNNANAMDVEYTRNIVSTSYGINDVGQQHFLDKAMRSFDHSPKLLSATFSDIRPVQLQGVQIGSFTVDVSRINAVMSACVAALHFHETGEKLQRWEIVLPNMRFNPSSTTDEQVGNWRQFLSLFSQMNWDVRTVNSPDVFEYAVSSLPDGRVYSMRFYKAFLVFCLKAPEINDG